MQERDFAQFAFCQRQDLSSNNEPPVQPIAQPSKFCFYSSSGQLKHSLSCNKIEKSLRHVEYKGSAEVKQTVQTNGMLFINFPVFVFATFALESQRTTSHYYSQLTNNRLVAPVPFVVGLLWGLPVVFPVVVAIDETAIAVVDAVVVLSSPDRSILPPIVAIVVVSKRTIGLMNRILVLEILEHLHRHQSDTVDRDPKTPNPT